MEKEPKEDNLQPKLSSSEHIHPIEHIEFVKNPDKPTEVTQEKQMEQSVSVQQPEELPASVLGTMQPRGRLVIEADDLAKRGFKFQKIPSGTVPSPQLLQPLLIRPSQTIQETQPQPIFHSVAPTIAPPINPPLRPSGQNFQSASKPVLQDAGRIGLRLISPHRCVFLSDNIFNYTPEQLNLKGVAIQHFEEEEIPHGSKDALKSSEREQGVFLKPQQVNRGRGRSRKSGRTRVLIRRSEPITPQPPKRGRGRPRKSVETPKGILKVSTPRFSNTDVATDLPRFRTRLHSYEPPPFKRPRGRPRKTCFATAKQEKRTATSESDSSSLQLPVSSYSETTRARRGQIRPRFLSLNFESNKATHENVNPRKRRRRRSSSGGLSSNDIPTKRKREFSSSSKTRSGRIVKAPTRYLSPKEENDNIISRNQGSANDDLSQGNKEDRNNIEDNG